MDRKNLFLLVGSLALLVLVIEPALACPDNLRCSNFTDHDKRNDCRYVRDQDLSKEEGREVLCILWDQAYEYDNLGFNYNNDIDNDLTLEAQEINKSSFILAGKIFIFGLMNYFIFSLSKYSLLLKWFGV